MADQTLKMDEILNSIGSGSTSDAEFKAYLESMNLNKGFMNLKGINIQDGCSQRREKLQRFFFSNKNPDMFKNNWKTLTNK